MTNEEIIYAIRHAIEAELRHTTPPDSGVMLERAAERAFQEAKWGIVAILRDAGGQDGAHGSVPSYHQVADLLEDL